MKEKIMVTADSTIRAKTRGLKDREISSTDYKINSIILAFVVEDQKFLLSKIRMVESLRFS